jgi:hypothetical protein
MALMLWTIAAGQRLLGILYSSGRTGICWAPMLTLAVLSLIRTEYVSVPALVFAAFSVAMFAGGFTTGYFPEWKGERHTKDMMRLIKARYGGREVRLGTTWPLEAGCNFYRRRFRLDWMKPVDRNGADGEFDHYYLEQSDAGLIEKRKLRTLFRDSETGTVLAEKP